MTKETNVYQFLNRLSIDYQEYHHHAVHTVAEAEKVWAGIVGVHCKNLFLRDPKGKNHFLVVLPHDKVLDMKELATKMGKGRLSFASPERLMKYLELTPGSVSPFGLINDQENHVLVYIDQELQSAERLGFHPNINHATITLAFDDFQHYLHAVGNRVIFFEI